MVSWFYGSYGLYRLFVCLDVMKLVHALSMRALVIYPTGQTWNEGYELCKSKNGQLLKFYSQEVDYVLKYFASKENNWETKVHTHFWIGLNTDRTSNVKETDFIFDDCQPVSSTWSNWEGGYQETSDKSCVLAKQGEYIWFKEKCSLQQQVMCELPSGPCTYHQENKICPTSNAITETLILTDADCRFHCDTYVHTNGWNCFVYNHDSNTNACTIYYSLNPYFCKSGTSSTTVVSNIRKCYRFTTSTDMATYTINDDNPKRDCTSWVPPTTTVPTTTTDTPTTTTMITTTEEVATNLSSEATTIPTDTPIPTTEATTTEATTSFPPTTPSLSTTEAPITTKYSTDAATTHSSTSTKDTTTAPITGSAKTPSGAMTTTSDASSNKTSSTEALLSTTEPTTVEKEHNKSTSTIMYKYTSSTDSMTPDSRFCVCDLCGKRNLTHANEEMKEILSSLKVNTLTLSSTRRKKESQPDDRPSARGLGYVGIILFITIFSLIFSLDAYRLFTALGITISNVTRKP